MIRAEYFTDGGRIVASFDDGARGFFMLRPGSLMPSWEFVVPGSILWDAIHQDLFYAGHVFDRCAPEEAAGLPLLPEVPKFKPLQWKDNFEPSGSLLAANFPSLAAALEVAPCEELRFFFALEEDRWETVYGDGKFLYFMGAVFIDEIEARAYSERRNTAVNESARQGIACGVRISIKSCDVRREGETLKPVGYAPAVYEHYWIEEVLAAIDKSYESRDRLARPEED